ncbi:MAG: hypothetical protein OXU30_05010, partial [Gammaproteobacteria bacterium]|nr:hypothetical protein [Gammaproteobacteria bacterium]
EDNRREEFDAENMRRALKGLPLREWVDEEEEEDAADSPAPATDDTTLADNEGDESGEEEDEEDPLILESGRILADFISLSQRRISAVDRISTQR